MNRATFWLVWAVGGGPLLLAVSMYFLGLFLPEERQHGGELLSGQHITAWQLQGLEADQQPHWKLLFTIPERCDVDCEQLWAKLSNLHIALGKDRERVQLWRISPQDGDIHTTQLAQLGEAIWIVDPLGNLVLRYRPGEFPEHLLRDLRKLLKISRIG